MQWSGRTIAQHSEDVTNDAVGCIQLGAVPTTYIIIHTYFGHGGVDFWRKNAIA